MALRVRRVRRKRRRHQQSRTGEIFSGHTAILIGVFFAALLLALLLFHYGPPTYRGWRESRLFKQGTELLRKNDLDGATKAAREMLRIQPDSVAAFQILADASERQNKPESVAWRAQIARIYPHSLDAQLNLASAALRFGQLETVRRTLEQVDADDRDKAAYHVVAGWLAKAEGNEADLEQHFAAAVKQEPANDLYQFNYAVLQIRASDEEKNAAGRETLERLSKVPAYRTGSLRALLNDAVQRNDLERADGLAQDLQMSQQVSFADYLLCLEFYRKLSEKKFNALLEKVKPLAAREPADAASLMEWLNRNGLAGEVLKWNDKLPSEITTVPPAAVAIADAFSEMKNWSRLKRWTRSAAWGEFEYLRLAYEAFATRQARQSAAEAEFNSLWQSAQRAASDHPEREAILARLATKWNLTGEATVLWKRVTKDAPLRREALDALFNTYRASNNLPELVQVAKQLHETSPREAPLACIYARLALVVASNTEEARRVAKEAYEAAPDDADCAVTYAFALYGAGRTTEGIEIVKKVTNEQLHDAHNAVYVALLLLDNNEAEAAREFIEAARKGPLYVEEKKLLDEAVTKLAAPSHSPTSSP